MTKRIILSSLDPILQSENWWTINRNGRVQIFEKKKYSDYALFISYFDNLFGRKGGDDDDDDVSINEPPIMR